VLRAGPVGSTPAANAVPQATAALAKVARAAGAQAYGVAGPDASLNDVLSSSNASLALVVPAILVLILVLLGLTLRTLVAPWYLALTVGLSYLSSLGFAMIVFVDLGGQLGLVFILPLLMIAQPLTWITSILAVVILFAAIEAFARRRFLSFISSALLLGAAVALCVGFVTLVRQYWAGRPVDPLWSRRASPASRQPRRPPTRMATRWIRGLPARGGRDRLDWSTPRATLR
jgi:hypothetical protein